MLVVAGAAAGLAPFAWPGLELRGWTCGGGGEEQVCRDLARRTTLLALGDAGWLWAAGGAACAAIALAGAAISREAW